MCWHKYKYSGYMDVQRWWGGVAGGILVEDIAPTKTCTKCGKIKIIDD